MRRLGCIADDFTGATDIAAVLAAVGRSVVVVFDHEAARPEEWDAADAVVVALKSRTAPVGEAVSASLAAAAWLERWGAEQFYVKYCSTFDSTPEGNIGPVVDAVAHRFALRTVLVAPAYPANGRTVYQSTLFVGHVPLDESSMKHHPLTPMTDANLPRLLEPQTRLPIDALYLADIREGAERIRQALAPAHPRIVVADAIDDADLVALAHASGEHVLLTGGAGLALGLEGTSTRPAADVAPVGHGANRLVVAGSASSMTRAQVAYARERMASRQLDITGLANGDDPTDSLVSWVADQWVERPGEPVLIYATAQLSDLDAGAGMPRAEIAERIENTLAEVSRRLLEHGLDALVVAGGETSGRVVSTLGVPSLRVGPEIAPGVVWAQALPSVGGRPIAIALKSGNFGGEDLFVTAWESLR